MAQKCRGRVISEALSKMGFKSPSSVTPAAHLQRLRPREAEGGLRWPALTASLCFYHAPDVLTRFHQQSAHDGRPCGGRIVMAEGRRSAALHSDASASTRRGRGNKEGRVPALALRLPGLKALKLPGPCSGGSTAALSAGCPALFNLCTSWFNFVFVLVHCGYY